MKLTVCLLPEIVISKFIVTSSGQQHKALSFSFTDLLNIKMLIFFYIYIRV
jgi:uncharacterized protein Veg